MAELTIDAADIASVLRKNVEGFRPEVDRAQVGRVLEVGDGIARVAGLPHAAVNELLEFEGGAQALALNLEEDTIGAVILGLGRAMGETIAVALVIGSFPRITLSLFRAGDAMASVIANQFGEASDVFRAALIALGVVLFALTILVNIAARAFISRAEKKAGIV